MHRPTATAEKLGAVVLLFSLVLSAEEPPHYTIYRTAAPISIDGRLDDPAWQHVPRVSDFHFNWWTGGEKEKTEVRMLWDDHNLYVSYLCHDKHISAFVKQRHGAVSNDDCVEIFISPNPDKAANYYTFEMNAIGTMLNRCKTDWWRGPATWDPVGVRSQTSLHFSAKQESPTDRNWFLELAIPFQNFSHDARHVPPSEGDSWRLNLYRTGGLTNRQDSSWSPISPGPHSFHRPECFGTVSFSIRTPPLLP